jgi:hypothetical protein
VGASGAAGLPGGAEVMVGSKGVSVSSKEGTLVAEVDGATSGELHAPSRLTTTIIKTTKQHFFIQFFLHPKITLFISYFYIRNQRGPGLNRIFTLLSKHPPQIEF